MIPILIWISGVAFGSAMCLAAIGTEYSWDKTIIGGIVKLAIISTIVGLAGWLLP